MYLQCVVGCLWAILYITLSTLIVTSITRLVLITVLITNVFKEAQMPTNINSTNASELIYFLRGVSVVGQVMENFALLIGVIKFNCNTKTSALGSIFSCKKTNERYDGCLIVCSVGVVVLLNFAVSFVPIVLLLHWTEELFQNEWINVARPYAFFASISFFTNFIARVVMITATIAVGNAWMPQLKGKNIEKMIDEYKISGRLVAAIQRIFQEWFVIKWIVYFVDITVDSIIAIRSLFGSNIRNEKDTIIYIIIHLTYNSVAFMTVYVCGGLMNSFHERYCKKVEKKIRSTDCKGGSWKKQCALSKLRKRKYKFIPSLCGFSIPLDSSGYTLSLLLALVAFIANFVSTLY